MPKSRQKIVVFIEPAEYLYETPYKIGNLITNRFTINEELNNDIVKIVHVAHRFYELRKLDKNKEWISDWQQSAIWCQIDSFF